MTPRKIDYAQRSSSSSFITHLVGDLLISCSLCINQIASHDFVVVGDRFEVSSLTLFHFVAGSKARAAKQSLQKPKPLRLWQQLMGGRGATKESEMQPKTVKLE